MTDFKTTHAERVAMLAEDTLEDLNEMWMLLLIEGTDQAIAAYSEAMMDCGYTLDLNPETPFAEVVLWRERA